MIRIDEIYYNVFLPRVQHRTGVGLHWFDPFGSVRFEDIRNVPPVNGTAQLRILFWDQEPMYQETVSEFMGLFQNVYQGPCCVVTSEKNSRDLDWVKSTYGVDSQYYFFHGWAALDWYRGYDHCFLSQPWHQRHLSHRIFCPNNIISGRREHRVRLVASMAQRDLLPGNWVSAPKACPFSGESFTDICQRLQISLPDIDLPLLIDTDHNHAGQSHRIDFWQQANQSFCHVVTETVYDDQRWHLTEKIFKPIVMQQPFVLVGPRQGLRYLREYGFKTFGDIWDESYDDLPGPARLERVVNLLEQINSWTAAELADAQQAVAATVEHNQRWFYTDFQHVLWEELTEMVDRWR